MSIVNVCSLVCYFFEVVPEHSPLPLLSELMMIQAQTLVLPTLAGYKHATIVTFFVSFTGGYTMRCRSTAQCLVV